MPGFGPADAGNWSRRKECRARISRAAVIGHTESSSFTLYRVRLTVRRQSREMDSW